MKPKPPRQIFNSCFPLGGELLDKESPYDIDPALLEAKVRPPKPVEGKFQRQPSTRDPWRDLLAREPKTYRGTLVGFSGGEARALRKAPITFL